MLRVVPRDGAAAPTTRAPRISTRSSGRRGFLALRVSRPLASLALLLAESRARARAYGRRGLLMQRCLRARAHAAACAASGLGERDRAAVRALTIRIVALRELAPTPSECSIVAEALVRSGPPRE